MGTRSWLARLSCSGPFAPVLAHHRSSSSSSMGRTPRMISAPRRPGAETRRGKLLPQCAGTSCSFVLWSNAKVGRGGGRCRQREIGESEEGERRRTQKEGGLAGLVQGL